MLKKAGRRQQDEGLKWNVARNQKRSFQELCDWVLLRVGSSMFSHISSHLMPH